jgi:hypothetical protein
MLRKREQGSSTAAMAIVIPSSWLSVERILWDCCRFIICFANMRGGRLQMCPLRLRGAVQAAVLLNNDGSNRYR